MNGDWSIAVQHDRNPSVKKYFAVKKFTTRR